MKLHIAFMTIPTADFAQYQPNEIDLISDCSPADCIYDANSHKGPSARPTADDPEDSSGSLLDCFISGLSKINRPTI
jgi:hypothetical protein